MDHPLSVLDAQIRPWRTAAYVAGAVAAVELVLLLVLGGGALAGAIASRLELAAADKAFAPVGRQQVAPAARKPAPAPAAHRPRSRTTVLVLNGNGRQGAAAVAGGRVHSRGYRISAVTNAPRDDFRRSIVMYRPGFAGEGHRLARDLGVKVVGPLDGMRVHDLGKAQLVFVLGR